MLEVSRRREQRRGAASASASIRAARPDEAQTLSDLALRSKGSWGYPPRMVRAFQAELTLTAGELEDAFVIEVEGVVARFYSLLPTSPDRVELGHLFVEPAWHGRGLGRSMVEDALRRSGQRGFRVLEIQGDPHAAPFYRCVGATQVGERESESVPGRMLPLFEISVPRQPGSSRGT